MGPGGREGTRPGRGAWPPSARGARDGRIARCTRPRGLTRARPGRRKDPPFTAVPCRCGRPRPASARQGTNGVAPRCRS